MTGERVRSLSVPVIGFIWFGASVSLAEILTGTFFAPLGLEMGLMTIVVGHLVGGALFWLVSLVSARTGMSAMQAVARSFGRGGAGVFSLANVVQLVGWTAIMVMSGAAAAALLVPQLGMAGWCVAIGALIALWIAIGVKRMGRVQSVAAALLFVLTFALYRMSLTWDIACGNTLPVMAAIAATAIVVDFAARRAALRFNTSETGL